MDLTAVSCVCEGTQKLMAQSLHGRRQRRQWAGRQLFDGPGASGTFARPPAPASRYNDVFVPRKMEFKGWVTDYTRSSFQGITLDEVMRLIVDLQKMVPNEFHQYIDWNQTRTEQGQTKTIVNMWSKNEANLETMIGLLKVVTDELKTGPWQNS